MTLGKFMLGCLTYFVCGAFVLLLGYELTLAPALAAIVATNFNHYVIDGGCKERRR